MAWPKNNKLCVKQVTPHCKSTSPILLYKLVNDLHYSMLLYGNHGVLGMLETVLPSTLDKLGMLFILKP